MEEQAKSPYCNCLYYSANALSRIITRIAEEEFSVTGLAPSYAFLLMTVNRNSGIQPMEISRIMQLTPSTVTRLIEKMEARNFVTRETEGKFTKVFPTDKAKALDKTIKSAWQNLYHRYMEVLGEAPSRDLTTAIYDAAQKLGKT